MPDRQQLYDALRKADAAGNTADAKQLADYIRAMPAESAPAAAPQPAPISQPATAAPSAVPPPIADPYAGAFDRPEDQQELLRTGPAGLRSLAQFVVPAAAGLALTPAAGIVARLAMAGAAGGGASLASEAIDPTPGGLKPALKRAAFASGSSMLGEGIGSGVSYGLSKIAPAISKFAQNQGAKALGLIGGGFRKTGLDPARTMAQEALDAGVISPLASAETMLGRAVPAGDDAGKALGGYRSLIDSLDAGDDVAPIARQLEGALTDWQPGTSAELAFKPHMQRSVKDLEAYADPSTGKIGAESLAKLKKMFSDTVYTDPLISPAQLTGALKPRTETARGVVQGAEEALAGRVLSPDDFGGFQAAKVRYGAMAKAEEALKQRAAKDLGNNQVFGLSTQLATLLGATAAGGAAGYAAGGDIGSLGKGLAVGAAARFGYLKGNQITATAANRLAQLAASSNSTLAIRTAAQAIVASLNQEP